MNDEGTDAEIVRDRLLAQDVLQRAGSGLAKQFVDEGLEALDRLLAVVEAAKAWEPTVDGTDKRPDVHARAVERLLAALSTNTKGETP